MPLFKHYWKTVSGLFQPNAELNLIYFLLEMPDLLYHNLCICQKKKNQKPKAKRRKTQWIIPDKRHSATLTNIKISVVNEMPVIKCRKTKDTNYHCAPATDINCGSPFEVH